MLLHALSQSSILACFLHTTNWHDFHALLNVSRAFRHNLWAKDEWRDTILAHFIPGYKYALELCDPHQVADVPIDAHDLALLSTSHLLSAPGNNADHDLLASDLAIRPPPHLPNAVNSVAQQASARWG